MAIAELDDFDFVAHGWRESWWNLAYCRGGSVIHVWGYGPKTLCERKKPWTKKIGRPWGPEGKGRDQAPFCMTCVKKAREIWTNTLERAAERTAEIQARPKQPQPKESSISHDVTPTAREVFNRMLEERQRAGIETYGTTLKTFNGRDPIRDLLEEIIDAWQYAIQIKMERDAQCAEPDWERFRIQGVAIRQLIDAAAAVWTGQHREKSEQDTNMHKLGIALHNLTRVEPEGGFGGD